MMNTELVGQTLITPFSKSIKEKGNLVKSLLMGAVLLSGMGSVLGCSDKEPPNEAASNSDKTNPANNSKADNDDESAANTAVDSITSDNAKVTPLTTGGTTARTDTIVTGQPVVYDAANWSTGNEAHYSVNDLKQMQEVLGEVTSTDENSLDYASNTAVKYRFMADDAPYLDIIDSQNYLELGWYYANPDDSEEQKQLSIDHAKKAYQWANHLMGTAGGTLVQRMLTNQIIRNEVVGEQYVELAKCEFYSCMLILKKVEG